ncbi:MAG: phosphoribosylformylglycinamidine cyclo-ligase [Candidatus Cloacimonetes bacterium]|nr:phosphoribosylformylglycinamidine cyclo-ligase [Candidatus Cloacimonadota bacterium]
MDYRSSGVDISAGNETVKRIKPLVRETFNSNVLSELGSFGGFYVLELEKWSKPVLVSSTDGVGTKLLIAKSLGKYDTIGSDLVNHCVNDIFVHGAVPLFFLDYIGIGKVDPEMIKGIVEGMVFACKEHNMALIGGETAEMAAVYDKGDFDLVGTIIGCVERENIINGSTIREGDQVIGFPSSGLHTNGYSLARSIVFEKMKLEVTDLIDEFGKSVGEELLTVHKSYYQQLRDYATPDQIHGMAHITGGGIAGNLSRIIADDLYAEIDSSSWKRPQIFEYLQREGEVSEEEMFRVFNMGIGFVTVVPSSTADVLVDRAEGINIGCIKKSVQKAERVIIR